MNRLAADDRTHAEEGDPALMDEATLETSRVFTPQRLYFNWERTHWSAGALDFETDRRDWRNLPADVRTLLVNSVAPFFVGEARVANSFTPILMSAEDDHERAYLASQQVDEARHLQFFTRFWQEVFLDDEEHESAIAHASARCNTAFTQLFDQRLKNALDRLQQDPTSVRAKVEAIAIYHLVVEGVLGLTAMTFLLAYLRQRQIMPAIAEGMANAKRDEHRHIAYGTWFLRRECRRNPELGALVQNTVAELLPCAAGIVLESGLGCCNGINGCEFLGYPSAAVHEYALTAISRRLQVIGGGTEELQQLAATAARQFAAGTM